MCHLLMVFDSLDNDIGQNSHFTPQVRAYIREEIGQMLNGRYNDPMPIYDKSIDGFPYSDLSPEFQSRLLDRISHGR